VRFRLAIGLAASAMDAYRSAAKGRSMERLTRIISETLRLGPDKITPATAIHETPSWNSLTHIELVVAIEETFNIQLQEDEIVAMTNVEAIRNVLAKRVVLEEK
jgi:acyl carrier protein